MPDKTISVNRKGFHDYYVLESVEAGLVLTGSEIKSLRAGKVSLREAYAQVEKGEMWLLSAHIPRYEPADHNNHEPTRPRKLLLHKDQILELGSKAAEKGLTLIPLRLYIKDDRAKVEVGLARGKKLYDKREAIAQRDAQRQMERDLRTRSRTHR